MEHAYEHSFIKKVVMNVIVPPAVRETASRAAYSTNEFEQIFKVLAPMISFSRALLIPYAPTGKGSDPRKRSRKGIPRAGKSLGQGWNRLIAADDGRLVPQDDNLRWYFENVMHCTPLPSTRENHIHQQFFQTAKRNYGGLKKLYRSWGVSSFVDTEVIMPLVVELIAETGLNVESLISLKRDCFKEAHPLTGLPYLDYYKGRSGGDKELHLTLYDDQTGQMGLKQGQSRVIGNSIKTLLALTEPLVEKANAKDREYLFLSQRRNRSATGRVARVERLSLKVIVPWVEKIVKKHGLRGDDGKPLRFTLSRFRPTKITEMVCQGYDFFNIMAMAGHASVITTLRYIDNLKFTSDFHHKMKDALTIIKRNKSEYDGNPRPIAITRNVTPSKFIFKGPVCHCKNPYDPPEVVRKSSTYTEGDACSYWNMCLQCENVLITEMNLPKLIAFRNEIELALSNLTEIPVMGELYKRMKMILDAVLVPDELFSKASLQWAAEVARTMEFDVLDSFIARNVEVWSGSTN